MPEWNSKVDIRMTRDGDLMWGAGDFAKVRNEECAAQDGYIYLHTAVGSYGYWPLTGNDLMQMIGQIVRDNTADEVRERIVDCVTQNGRVPKDSVQVVVNTLDLGDFSIRVDLRTDNGFVTLLPEVIFNASGVWRID